MDAIASFTFWLLVVLVGGPADVESVNVSARSYHVVTIIKPPLVMYDEATGKWSGYCIDLLEEIRKQLDLEYTIGEVPDKEYGHVDEEGLWNGMVKQLMDKEADIALGGLSVSAERARVIDFTQSIHEHAGISIIRKKPTIPRSLLTFVNVLDAHVCWLIAGSYLCTSLLVHFFDKYSPYSQRNSRDDSTRNLEFTLKESLWFCISSLTSLGGARAPTNLSGQLLAATWWLFGFIIVATYTANVAVSSTIPKLDEHVGSLDDLSRQYAISYAPVGNSPEYRYFESMAAIEEKLHRIWSDMSVDEDLTILERSKLAVWDFPLSSKYIDIFTTMNTNAFPVSMEAALDRVRGSQSRIEGIQPTEQFALIAEASDVKYLAMIDCDLMQVGQEFSKKPYAIGLQKGSPLKRLFDNAIYVLQDENRIEKLKRKWWDENPNRKYCNNENDPNYGIDIRDIGGVFIMVVVAISIAYIILIFEYYQYRVKRTIEPNNRKTIAVRSIDKTYKFNIRPAPICNLDLDM